MSFVLSFAAPVGTELSVKEMVAWLAADDRVGEPAGRADSFEAVTLIGGEPWAAFLVEDVSDLDPEDLVIDDGPDNLAISGVRLEMSYSTPEPIAHAVFELAAAFADRFGLGVLDEQSDTATPVGAHQLRVSWTEAQAMARAAFEEHVRRDA